MFSSKTKYEAGTGWPSFYDVVDKAKVVYKEDASGVGANLLLVISRPDMIRTEVSCRNCGAHIGHVFKDGPKPTGQRYCVNSSSLDFMPEVKPEDMVDQAAQKVVVPEEEVVIACPATLGGCDGSGGVCSLKARENVKARIEELVEESAVVVEKKVVGPEEEVVIVCPATMGGCDGSEGGVCSLKARENVMERLKELNIEDQSPSSISSGISEPEASSTSSSSSSGSDVR